MNKNVFFAICISIFAVSCSNSELYLSEDETATPSKQIYVSVPDTSQLVTLDNIKSVATGAMRNNATRSMGREIQEIVTVYHSEGEPAFYIVNYKNNLGYVVVSASKDYMPVLAFNEKGNLHLDDDEQTGLSEWISEQKIALSHVASIPDSIKQGWRKEWHQFTDTKRPITLPCITRVPTYEEAMEIIREGLAEYEAQGYTVYTYADYLNTYEGQNLQPAERGWLDDAIAFYANYFYGNQEDVSFIICKTTQTNSSRTPLLETNWGQQYGYNDSIPYNFPVGCVAVAMGQVMKYHQHPTTFNWAAMDNNYATPATAGLLKHIGAAVNMQYGPNGSYSTFQDACNAFYNYYGYHQVSWASHSANLVMGQLNNSLPVLMGGSGHAWVCDGYQYSKTDSETKLVVLSQNPDDSPCMIYTGWNKDTFGTPIIYLHINWGKYGSYNGYYNDASLYIENYNYTPYRQIVYNIYP